MLDFGRQPAKPNYPSRGQQRQLFMLVFALGLTVIAISKLAEPETWAWFAHMNQPQPAKANDASVATVPEHAATLPKGDKRYFPGVDKQLLASVEDGKQLKPSEVPAMLQLLGVLRRSAARDLEEASLGTPAYAQLMKQPDAFRGQLLTIRGRVKGVLPVDAPANDQGIRELLQLWIAPTDGAGAVAIDCLDLPKTFPRGTELSEPVSVTGFFFKKLVYFDGDAMRVAPLLLAKQIEWTPRVVAAEPEPESPLKGILWAVSISVVAAIALLSFVLRQRRREPANPYQAAAQHARGRGFGLLDDLRDLEVSPDASEALRRIAAAEQAGQPKDTP